MIITDHRFRILTYSYKELIPLLDNLHSDFGGPSFYFHSKAVSEAKSNFLSDRHIELIYATLASWGMHRMGDTKTKMVDFDIFKDSILSLKTQLDELYNLSLTNHLEDWGLIDQKIITSCFNLKVSISNSKLVGNSKTLAHILPNLVPPMDRQYSIRFFSRNLSNFRNIEEEKEFFSHILSKCREFILLLQSDDQIRLDERFNTSYPKIFDNLIMLFLKKFESGA